MKYVLVQWPESKYLMNHKRFHECLLVVNIDGHDEVTSSAYMCPEDLYIDIFDNQCMTTKETPLRDKLSALLMDTDEKHHMKVYIPLDLKENVGLSTNDMITVKEIWQNPTEGIIMLKLEGIDNPVELEKYEEAISQIYEHIKNI